jgi:RNA polymerase sigma-70 factor (ECF subfamily)
MSVPLVIRVRAVAAAREREGALPVMDEEAFRAFYERTARQLWAYLARVCGDPQQADDLLQEAYYRFYRAGARHESEAHRRHSLFHIATNLVRDAGRRAGRSRQVPLDEERALRSAVATDAPQPERRAAARTDLERAMRHLPPVQRQMLWLAYAQGASHEEVAATLGLRATSVRTTLLRARRKLAALLGAGGATGAGGEGERS